MSYGGSGSPPMKMKKMRPAPAGTHRMPDGSLMTGTKHNKSSKPISEAAARRAAAKKKNDSPFDDVKEGALRKQLKIPEGKKIPRTLLRKIMKAEIGDKINGLSVTALLKRRANFALNFGK